MYKNKEKLMYEQFNPIKHIKITNKNNCLINTIWSKYLISREDFSSKKKRYNLNSVFSTKLLILEEQ